MTDYGAVGDDRTVNTRAIQSALDYCAKSGGGRAVIPAARFRSGTLNLRSDVSLVIEAGAVLAGSDNLDDYVEPDKSTPPETPSYRVAHFVRVTASRRLFVYGSDVRNVSIEGRGTIDGNRVREKTGERGPLTVLIEHASNVTLQSITVTRSPGWAVTLFDCRQVKVLGVRLKDAMADGINPVSCQDVVYDGVVIDGTGDDPICLKNEGPAPGAHPGVGPVASPDP